MKKNRLKLFVKAIKPKQKSLLDEKLAFKMLKYIKQYGTVKGYELEEKFTLTAKTVRDYIQHIRENNHIFHNPSNKGYIVADKDGYHYTTDETLKAEYLIKLDRAIKSKNKQRDQLLITLERSK